MAAGSITKLRTCPRCKSNRLRHSKPRGIEWVWRFCGLGFTRCANCNHRFSTFRKWGKSQKQAIVGLFLLVGLAIFVWAVIKGLRIGRGVVD